MFRHPPARRLVGAAVVLFALLLPGTLGAMPIKDPDALAVLTLCSRGEDGAAWLQLNPQQNLLVTPGYLLRRDLRVTAVRRDSVVLYDLARRVYHTLVFPETVEPLPVIGKQRHHEATIRGVMLPLWMVLRVVAAAFRADYICHSLTASYVQAIYHARDLEYLLRRVMPPLHSMRVERNIVFCSPNLVAGVPWTVPLGKLREYKSDRLAEWYPPLGKTGSLVSDGKDLFAMLKEIEKKTKVPIIWPQPVNIPLYCSLRERPWHEILETVVIFNGLGLYARPEGVMVGPPR